MYFNFTLQISPKLNNAGDFLLRRTNQEFVRGQYLTDIESLLTKGIFPFEYNYRQNHSRVSKGIT